MPDKKPPTTKLAELVERGHAAARAAQARLAKAGVGQDGSRYAFDQATGRLTFTREGEGEPWLVAEASILGSYSRGSWLWAWANESVLETVAGAAHDVRAFGLEHRVSALTSPVIVCEEADAAELVMASFAITSPKGFYKAPTATGFVVLFVHEVKAQKAKKAKRAPAPKESAAPEAPAECSLMITTTHEVKSKHTLKDKNARIIEEQLTAALAKARLGFALTVRFSVGLFPFDSAWGKVALKKARKRGEWVASTRYLVLESNIDDTVYRKLDPAGRMAAVRACLSSAVDTAKDAKRLPPQLDVAKLQAALRGAIARLPLLT
jgi:hypothetical protein